MSMDGAMENIFGEIDFDQIKKHPNILIAAHFWESDRYLAARACYKFMRTIDDLIDERKALEPGISCFEKEDLTDKVNDWIDCLHRQLPGGIISDDLLPSIQKYKIPLQLYYTFARSMIYDINHNAFQTLDDFIHYAEGASNSPASIFLHLCCLERENGAYNQPIENIRDLARPCAMFSYIVHIIRDFEEDQKNNLNYFALDTLGKHNLTVSDLERTANGLQPVSDDLRNVMREYYDLATAYKEKTIEVLNYLEPRIAKRYFLSLKIIFDLYLQVYERIDIKKGNFRREELNPTPDETRNRVWQCLKSYS